MQQIDEAVAEILVEVEPLGIDDLAVGLGEADITFGKHALGFLVVGDTLRFQHGAEIVDLDIADRVHALVGVVVMHLVRLNEHLRRGVGLASHEPGGCGGRSRAGRYADPGRGGLLRIGRPAAERAHGKRRAGHKRQRAEADQIGWTSGGRPGHHPSSWCNRTTMPLSALTSTGDHAAATGLIKSALLKSSVTFAST